MKSNLVANFAPGASIPEAKNLGEVTLRKGVTSRSQAAVGQFPVEGMSFLHLGWHMIIRFDLAGCSSAHEPTNCERRGVALEVLGWNSMKEL